MDNTNERKERKDGKGLREYPEFGPGKEKEMEEAMEETMNRRLVEMRRILSSLGWSYDTKGGNWANEGQGTV